MPYSNLSQRLKIAALDLKEKVVRETWGRTGEQIEDYCMYRGSLGTVYLLFKAYQSSDNRLDRDDLISFYIDVTFLLGRAGVCALGAVAAKNAGDDGLLNYYIVEFRKIKLPKYIPIELFYGRAGFIFACLFLNKHIGEGTIPAIHIGAIANDTIEEGRKLGVKRRCPLMYEFGREKYWGAAHGLAGILQVLMQERLKPDEAEDVRGTLKYVIKHRFPSGNYPSSEEISERDYLVHWCHGAPGMALTLVKAFEGYGDNEFLEAAVKAAEVVWNRGLLKRVGLCHGISGNVYVFLSLYRLTGKMEFFYKAKAFTCFLLDRAHKLIAEGQMHGGDKPYSLFEGIGGMSYLFLDMTEPAHSRFPGYEL